jgi:hypothetical protein
MAELDRGHHLIGARTRLRRRCVEHGTRACDPCIIPQARVLLRQGHHCARRIEARARPRARQQHQRGQPQRLALVGQQLCDQQRQPLDLGAEILAEIGRKLPAGIGIGGGEGELEREQHRPQPLGPGAARRQFEGDSRLAHLRLGAGDALEHRGFANHEEPRDRIRGQAADHLERERGAHLGCQRRVATDEQQTQPFVGYRLGQCQDLGHVGDLCQCRAAARFGARPAQRIECAALGGDEQPGRAVARRLGEREQRGGSLGKGILGRIEIAQTGSKRGHHPGPRRHDRLPDSRRRDGLSLPSARPGAPRPRPWAPECAWPIRAPRRGLPRR